MPTLDDAYKNGPPEGPSMMEQNTQLRAALRRSQSELYRAKLKVDDLVAATIQATVDTTLALGPIPKIPAPKLRISKKAQVALWDTGDWQFSKITPSYNSDVAEKRVREFVRKCQEYTSIQRGMLPVNDAVIVFGGDMVEGLFNFPTQPFEIDATLFEQYVRVSRLIVEVVQSALSTYRHVTVVPEWGNHGRIGSKRDAVVRSDNIDRMCFELAKQLLTATPDPRLTWQDCPEDVQRLEIGNYRALVMHGDEVGRNGFASPSTLRAHVERWKSGAYRVNGVPWHFRDVYSHHYHTHAEWPMADGEGAFYQTGSTESDNRYANIGMASAAIPSQRLHFIDPVKGVVVSQHKIFLD